MRALICAAVAIAIVVALCKAHAEPPLRLSLQEAVSKAELVVIAKVTHIKELSRPKGTTFIEKEVLAEVDSVLKGKRAAKEIKINYLSTPGLADPNVEMATGKFILFLMKAPYTTDNVDASDLPSRKTHWRRLSNHYFCKFAATEENIAKVKKALDKRIEELIKNLGSEKFKEREAAQKELVKIGKPAVPQLKKVLKHKDLEIQERANKALRAIYWLEGKTVKGLQVLLRPGKKTYKAGDDIIIEISFRNVGKGKFYFLSYFIPTVSWRVMNPKGEQLDVKFVRYTLKTGEKVSYMNSQEKDYVILQPGQDYTKKIKNFTNSGEKDFEPAPGKYQVTLIYEVDDWEKERAEKLIGLKGVWTGKVISNTITIEIRK